MAYLGLKTAYFKQKFIPGNFIRKSGKNAKIRVFL
jgi:hypothetical protein